MDRCIEFRGKSKRNGEWVYGGIWTVIHYNDNNREVAIVLNGLSKEIVDANTIGQYIGLEDVNGIKIFEGDVVEVTCKFKGKVEYENCGIVKYIGNAFVLDIFTSDEENETFPIYESICNDEREDTFIVVGNVYDDKDLLGGNNKWLYKFYHI